MIATSDPEDYGDLTVYETPQGTVGPANADQKIQANPTVSSDITLYDQHGSEVLLGNTLMVPVGQSIIYLRPLYVASSTNPLPQLTDVIGVLGQKVVVKSTLSATLSSLLNTTISTPGNSSGGGSGTSPGTGTVPTAVQQDLAAAQADYTSALAALSADDLGTYQTDINAMQKQITNAQQALGSATGTSTTTTTTAPPKSKSSKSTGKTSTTTSSLATAEPSG